MAIANIIRCTIQEPILIWKWHDDNYSKRQDEIRLGSQLIVSENQQAIFVKGGKICDVFETGQHTLATANLPILSQAIGSVFGGNSPFNASIYFVNKAVLMNTKFGLTPFNLVEPNFKVPIPVSARGSYALKISDARNLLIQICGNLTELTPQTIKEYFKGIVCTIVKNGILELIKQTQISPIELETKIDDVTKLVSEDVSSTFAEYGLISKHFVIEAIPIIDDDPRVKDVVSKIHQIWAEDVEEKMKFRRHTENIDIYKTERMFDTAQSAAENLGGNGIAGAFIGMNAVQPLGSTIGSMLSGVLNNGTQAAGKQIDGIKCDKCGTVSPIGTKFCIKCGDAFVVCPACKKDNPSQTKFCIFCGSPMKLVCKNCGAEYIAGAVFCGECGQKL